MLDRDTALNTIRGAYAARVEGDKDALATFWAEGSHFEIAGDHSLLEALPRSGVPTMEAVSELMDHFRLSELELLNAVVDGGQVAARWKVTVSAVGNEPVTTQLFDLFQLDDEGKIVSLIQFADTALVRQLVAGRPSASVGQNIATGHASDS